MTHEVFEEKIMNKLLEGTEEVFVQLKKQFLSAKVLSREFTGHGFFTKFEVSDELSYNQVSGRIDDVIAKFKDPLEAEYFILYIDNGKIDTLEGYCTLDDWNDNYAEAKVEYCFKDKRDYELFSM